MARVLYTSTRGGVWSPGIIEASTLGEARRQLQAREHTRIAFWSHPALGDAPGESPEDAYRRAPKPRTWFAWLLAALLAACAPGSLGLVALMVLEHRGSPPPEPLVSLVVVALFMGGQLVGIPALLALRLATARGQYGVATALLWGMRVASPFVAPVLVLWGAQIRAGRMGPERAMRPYAWLRHVGLRGVYDALENGALNHCGEHALRAEKLRARFDASPTSQLGVELALVLGVQLGDHAAARDVLARTPRGGGPMVHVVRELVSIFAELERGDAVPVAAVESLRRTWVRASQGTGGIWMPFFDLAASRAALRSGQRELAERYFARASRELLWSGDIEPLDRMGRELDAARRAPVVTPEGDHTQG